MEDITQHLLCMYAPLSHGAEYMRTGSKLQTQTRIWSSKYGAALVDMIGGSGLDEEDEGGGRRRGALGPRVWKRRFNPDDDDNDYILVRAR